jgi:hypothetical protein
MKISGLALLVVAASKAADAFLTPPSTVSIRPAASLRSLAVDMAVDTNDISVPYDAAARLAYEEWCAKYNRPIDEARYEVFKGNYEAITVINVSAKKQARDSNSNEAPSLLLLNEYADCTQEEYEAALNGESSSTSSDPTSTGDILGKAVKAVESQSAASNALQEAADALAEEEEVRSLTGAFLLTV